MRSDGLERVNYMLLGPVRYQYANVKHFFTLLGKMFFTSYGKEFFTYHGKQIFTLPGTTFLHGMVSRLCCLFNFSDKGPGASAGRILL